MTDGVRHGAIDRVAATGAFTALVGCLLPSFVSIRANRIVPGEPRGLLVAAGPWGWALLALVLATGIAAAVPSGRRRATILQVLGGAELVVLAWTVGASAVRLLAGAGPFARVSIGTGAWLVVVGAVMVESAGHRREAGRSRTGARAIDAAAALGALAAVPFGGLSQISIFREYAVQSAAFWSDVAEHLTLTGVSVAIGALIGIPLGVLAFRNGVVRRIALGVVGVIQTVPSLALLGLLVTPLAALRAASPFLAGLGVGGLGYTPAIIALSLYALLPIVRDTFVGLSNVDPAAVDAGRGMGMGAGELLLRVEGPLALPLVLEGLRTAVVLVIGITAVTAFAGAGGLGRLIFYGLGQTADDLVLLGAIPVILLAVAADLAFRGLARVVVSPGIRGTA